MELASILADEPFSDHPASVCPVVAAFLRSYNDHVDDQRRRDLFPYAAAAVGTAHGLACARAARRSACTGRDDLCCAAAARARPASLAGLPGPRHRWRVRGPRGCGRSSYAPHRPGLLDELIAVGQPIPDRSRSPASAKAPIRAG